MKKIMKTIAALLFMTVVLISCGERGPVGPEGPPGPPGQDGAEILPTSFEFNATLTPENDFEFFNEIPGDIDIIDSDVIIAFVFEDYIEEDDLEVWRQLPITEFNSKGTVLIDFDFTMVDVRIFLDANYFLSASDGYQDMLIRAVHIPANFASKMKTDALKNIQSPDELEQFLGVEIRKL
ncbi:MAG: hypothetical protein GVY20_17335 [Bacteroidetes bacterium]|jgi:hypothetical protein|nr:hypothetical protein [Bacteroidota bacterium]